MESSDEFVALFHRRWGVPLLAEVYRLSGAKFVTLTNKLKLSRDSLSRTLEALIAAGWLMRNPGYGHPLRPEYVLTSEGEAMAPACQKLLGGLRSLDIEEVALRKWSMPVVLAMCADKFRFSDLKAFLPGITPRALTRALKDLEAAGLIERRVSGARPARVNYQLTSRGGKLCPLLAELVHALTD